MEALKTARILVTGGGGLLAGACAEHFQVKGIEHVVFSKAECDVAESGQLEARVEAYRPDILVNCAAFMDVELADKRPELAYRVNADAAGRMAEVCHKRGIFLVHFGTNYVFDGAKNAPYTEEDATNPINIYGRSKLRGEQLIAENLKRFLILRTSWIFSEAGTSLLGKLRQWKNEPSKLSVASDEIASPTSMADLLGVLMMAVDQGLQGVFHVTNTGWCSRYDVAEYFFGLFEEPTEIEPVRLSAFGSKVERPLFSALSNEKISRTLGIAIATWEEAIRTFRKDCFPGG